MWVSSEDWEQCMGCETTSALYSQMKEKLGTTAIRRKWYLGILR